MNYQLIDWDSVPDVLNKDQFYRICHISKSTALHLLKSGKVPCEWSGKKTRCYKIKKEDVKAYLDERAVYPDSYSLLRASGSVQISPMKRLFQPKHRLKVC